MSQIECSQNVKKEIQRSLLYSSMNARRTPARTLRHGLVKPEEVERPEILKETLSACYTISGGR